MVRFARLACMKLAWGGLGTAQTCLALVANLFGWESFSLSASHKVTSIHPTLALGPCTSSDPFLLLAER